MKFAITTLTFFFLISLLQAQVMYDFQFNQNRNSTAVSTKAFLRLDANYDGFMRIRYQHPLTNKLVLVGVDVAQQIIATSPEALKNDSVTLFLSNVRILAGTDADLQLPSLLNGIYKITDSAFFPVAFVNENAVEKIALQNQELIRDSMLTEKLVLSYFSPTESFYQNLFNAGTRSLSGIEKNTRLILLAVGNTNDKEIGLACGKDIDRVVAEFRSITSFMGIRFEAQTITGSAYNKLAVQYAIAKLTPSSNDIVIFYYSGHGFRKPKDNRREPYIDLRTKEDNTYMVNSLNLADIYTQVKKKGARLTIVLGDCCNTLVEATNAESPNVIVTPKGFGVRRSLDNCRALFLSPRKMSMLIASADAGQKATSNDDLGSFFSYFFINTLDDAVSIYKKNMTWEGILSNAQRLTKYRASKTYCDKPYEQKNICSQLPYYNVFFER